MGDILAVHAACHQMDGQESGHIIMTGGLQMQSSASAAPDAAQGTGFKDSERLANNFARCLVPGNQQGLRAKRGVCRVCRTQNVPLDALGQGKGRLVQRRCMNVRGLLKCACEHRASPTWLARVCPVDRIFDPCLQRRSANTSPSQPKKGRMECFP
jgi:hypothetical protein